MPTFKHLLVPVDTDVTGDQPLAERLVDQAADLAQALATGTVLGAVAGGVLGNVIGGGGKNTVAKIAGAAAGGYAGNKTQEHLQENDTYQTTERVCKTVYDESERTVAYNVDYKIGDVPGKVRLDHDPGDTIPVQDGQLVIARESRANESGTQ